MKHLVFALSNSSGYIFYRVFRIPIIFRSAAIGGAAFCYCSKLREIELPRKLNAIRDYLFYDCVGLTSVVITQGVGAIGRSAFEGCIGLTSITIPSSVSSIGYKAFNGCSGLSSVVMADGVASMAESVFEGCDNLTLITLSSTLTSIGKDAFANCLKLKSVSLPACSKIEKMFRGCASLESIVIAEGANSVVNGAFENCVSLTSISLPSSIENIGEMAFQGCTGLKSIKLPDALRTIQRMTFKNCSSLHSVELPDGLKVINYEAFYGCESMTSISIPTSLIYIGHDTFWGTSLREVYVSDLVKWCDIDFEPYNSCSNPLRGSNLFFNGKKIESLKIPEGVTTVKDYAFYFCQGLTSLEIPSSVSSIGTHAFCGCLNGESQSLDFPNGLRQIGEYAFSDCSGVVALKIPASVETIGINAFWNCPQLKTIFVDYGCKEKVKSLLLASGMQVDKLFICEDEEGIGSIDELPSVFPSDSEIVKYINTDDELKALNEFLKKSKMHVENLTAQQKQWAYRAFKLSEITTAPQLFEEEPVLKIDDVELSGGNLSLTISLTAGAEAIQLAKDKLVEKIRVGDSPDTVDNLLKDEDVISTPSEDGSSLTFTIKPPRGNQGFVKIKID